MWKGAWVNSSSCGAQVVAYMKRLGACNLLDNSENKLHTESQSECHHPQITPLSFRSSSVCVGVCVCARPYLFHFYATLRFVGIFRRLVLCVYFCGVRGEFLFLPFSLFLFFRVLSAWLPLLFIGFCSILCCFVA